MIADKQKLQTIVEDTDAMVAYLDGLSNARLRVSQQVLSDEILPFVRNSRQFWHLFVTLYKRDKKMWLGVLLKALANRIQNLKPSETLKSSETPTLFFDEVIEAVSGLSGEFSDIDRQKVINSTLPLAEDPEQAKALFRACRLTETIDWIGFLLPVRTQVAGFLLLGALRYVEHDKVLIVRVCRFLMKRGDAMAFCLASIICLSYDIKDVHGTFSLHLAPYELSRIETNFAAFCQTVNC